MENQIARWRESIGGLQRGFSPEQRRAAVALVKAGREQGWSRSAVARGLGVSEQTLRIWERQKAALVPLRVAPEAVPEVRLLMGRMEARLDVEQLAQLVWRQVVIRLRRAARIHVHDGPADMRKSYDTLAALVREQMGAELFAVDVFLFVGKDRRRAKVLFFDGTGLCILQKRLSKGRFHAPWERQEITRSELERFLGEALWCGPPHRPCNRRNF